MKKALFALLACAGMTCTVSAYAFNWEWNLPDMFYTDTDWSDTYDVSVTLTLLHDVSLARDGSDIVTTVLNTVPSIAGTATDRAWVDYGSEGVTYPGASAGDKLFYTITTIDGKWQYTGEMFTFPTVASVVDQVATTNLNLWGHASISDANGDGILLPPGEANGWVAVPEPTSLALLALGVAAMGLRRKVK